MSAEAREPERRTRGAGGLPRPANAREMLAMARAFLERKELEEARLEAELLIARALDLDRMGLYLALERPVTDVEIDRARDLLVRRGRREPVAYITGLREFYGREFEVGPGVLVPRAETELLVDLARERCAERQGGAGAPRIADLGTGSGCIAVTLALEVPDARVWAVDRSSEALAFAQRNAERLGARVDFVEGEGLEALAALARHSGRGFDLLASNPPYVRPEERSDLPPEVRDYEPPLALYEPAGEPDHWLRRTVAALDDLLAPGGLALVELAAGRAAAARAICERAGREARLFRDLAGHDRVIEIRR